MDVKSLFGGIAIGKDTSGNFKLSIKGLAVRTPDKKFVVIVENHTLDVSDLILDGTENFVYRLPTQSIKCGDLVITSENPFSVLSVQDVYDDGKLTGLDPRNNTVIDYVPPTNLFNVQFFVRVFSLIEGLGGDKDSTNLLPLLLLGTKGSDSLTALLLMQSLGGKTLDNNSLLPLLLLGTKDDDSLTTLLLMQSLGGKTLDSNSLLLLTLLKDGKSDGLETLLLMQALGGGKNPFAHLLGFPLEKNDEEGNSMAAQRPHKEV